MTKDKKKKIFFPSQTNPAPVPKRPEDKTILSSHIIMLQRNKHKKVYLHDILDACTTITGKSISVKEIDPSVTDTSEPCH